MIRLLKELFWDLKHRAGRYQYVQALLKEVPGQFGVQLRSRVYARYFGRVGKNLRVLQDVRIRNIELIEAGDDLSLGDCCFLQAAGGIEFGDDVMLGPGVKIWSANHRFDDVEKPIGKQGYEFKKVTFGSHIWIGSNAFIMPGATIGDGVIVSAGAVVGAKTIPPYKIVAGNPARVIGTREKAPESKDAAARKES
jgi:maltose O-acetyltransferase